MTKDEILCKGFSPDIARLLREFDEKMDRLHARQNNLDKQNAKQIEVNAEVNKRLEKHEEQLMKLEQRLASAESELAFNREQRDRLFKLLDIEERERDASIEGSDTWQKHQRKIIALENQIHTVQKCIDKAHMDKAFCAKKINA
jgi:predicted  nucleic acid-binding Zn-ribbon protein